MARVWASADPTWAASAGRTVVLARRPPAGRPRRWRRRPTPPRWRAGRQPWPGRRRPGRRARPARRPAGRPGGRRRCRPRGAAPRPGRPAAGPGRRVELPGRLAELQRPPVVAGGVLVGQDGRGLLGGLLAVGDGPGRGRRGAALVDRPAGSGRPARPVAPSPAAASRAAAASVEPGLAGGSSWPYRTSRNRSWANRQGPSSPAGATSTLAAAASPSRASTVPVGWPDTAARTSGRRSGPSTEAASSSRRQGRRGRPAGAGSGRAPRAGPRSARSATSSRRPAGRGTGCRRCAAAHGAQLGVGLAAGDAGEHLGDLGASRPPRGGVRPSASSRAIGRPAGRRAPPRRRGR